MSFRTLQAAMNPAQRLAIVSSLALFCTLTHAQIAALPASSPPSSAAPLKVNPATAQALRKAFSNAHKNTPVAEFKDQDPAMRAAFKKAQASLDQFFTETSHPSENMETIALKVAVREGKRIEYFWITPFTRDLHGQVFSGAIDAKPTILKKLKEDQVVKFKRADIVDWMYVQISPRVMHGNYTTCVQAKDSPADLAALKAQYGLDCTQR